VQPTPPRSQPHKFKSSFEPQSLLTYQLRLVPLYSLSSPFRQQWFFPSGERSLLASTPCISNTISDRLHPPTGKHPLLSLGSIRALCKCSQLNTPKCVFWANANELWSAGGSVALSTLANYDGSIMRGVFQLIFGPTHISLGEYIQFSRAVHAVWPSEGSIVQPWPNDQ
jgi:hypothetical protein